MFSVFSPAVGCADITPPHIFMFFFCVFSPAVGCADITPAPDSAVERSGQLAKVTCLHGDREVWYLTCREVTWIGSHGNCSARKYNGK